MGRISRNKVNYFIKFAEPILSFARLLVGTLELHAMGRDDY
jgi:hypothetical protein